MTDEDDFVRITLRIPKKLHAELNDAAAKKKSMNAEIISRLEDSFEIDRLSGVGPFEGHLIRLHDELTTKIASAAKRMNRTIEAQAIDTLEKSYLPPKP